MMFLKQARSRLIAVSLVLVVFVVSGVSLVTAQTVTQGYNSGQALQRGMIVSLKDGDPNSVQASSINKASKVHGVVVNANDTPVTLRGESSQVFVATAGRYEVLVSSQNGDILQNDYIGVSSIDGIGMKANNTQPLVVGRAVVDFTSSSESLLTDKVGGQTVRIGRIMVDVNVAANPLARTTARLVPSFLQTAADAVAGKPVGTARIYMSILILLVTVGASGSILYSGIHSSIIAIGRNPLSSRSITRSLVQVNFASIIILIIGVFGVYLLLKT